MVGGLKVGQLMNANDLFESILTLHVPTTLNNMLVKLDHFPNFRGEYSKLYVETTT